MIRTSFYIVYTNLYDWQKIYECKEREKSIRQRDKKWNKMKQTRKIKEKLKFVHGWNSYIKCHYFFSWNSSKPELKVMENRYSKNYATQKQVSNILGLMVMNLFQSCYLKFFFQFFHNFFINIFAIFLCNLWPLARQSGPRNSFVVSANISCTICSILVYFIMFWHI